MRVLFICGSLNQTTQMHAIARALARTGPLDARFTPYYCDGAVERMRQLRLLEATIAGRRWRSSCLAYLERHGLGIDLGGKEGGWDLVLTCSDLFLPRNVRGQPLVLVQEGMTDPEGRGYRLRRALPFLPRWMAGTAATGQSDLYDRFCVASPGYRDLFVRRGVRPEKIAVTGIPNFDDCQRYLRNDFPYHHYVLVCTSDTRETWKRDDRAGFIRWAVELAGGRPLIFKLHPNERVARSTREIRALAPGARIYTEGCAEEMVANSDVLVVQYSTLAYVGLALGKEVHALTDLAELRRLLPLQGGGGARNIAAVCRDLVGGAELQAVAS